MGWRKGGSDPTAHAAEPLAAALAAAVRVSQCDHQWELCRHTSTPVLICSFLMKPET